MGKMRWLVSLMVVLSVCVYCTTADEPQQDRMEYDDDAYVMMADSQAERDPSDSRLADDNPVDDEEDRLIENNLVEDDNDDDIFAELQSTVNSWNAVLSKYLSTTISFQHISTSINYLWGTDQNYVYRCAKPCTTGRWARVAGRLKQVDVSDMEVWGVNRLNRVCKRPADGTGTWTEVRGQQLQHVSASGNGYIWGVSSSSRGYVYRCKKPCSGTWVRVYYSYNFKQVDGGEEYVFGVSTTNRVYRFPINGSTYGRWSSIPGKYMKYVSVGANDVFGVEASTSKVYRCALPCSTGSWKIINTCQSMKQVEATVGNIVGTSTDGKVFKIRV